MELFIFIIFLGYLYYLFRKGDTQPKIVWKDHGKITKPFFNNQYKIFGKLDAIEIDKYGYIGIEYKSRKGKIYDSDISQAKAAALAKRPKIYINRIKIITQKEQKIFNIDMSDEELYQSIKQEVEIARRCKQGEKNMVKRPSKFKCQSCSMKNSCI